MSRSFLVAVLPYDVRPGHPDLVIGPYDEPRWPGQLQARRETNDWWALTTAHGVGLHAKVVGRTANGNAVLVAVLGPQQVIDAIGAASQRAVSASELTSSGDAPVLALMRRWPWWRIDGEEDGVAVTNELRTLVPPLPASPARPSPSQPWTFGTLRVDRLVKPAFPFTMSGFADHEDAEA